MNLIGAVARRDLFRRMRRPHFYLERVSIAAVAGLLLTFTFANSSTNGTGGLWSFMMVLSFLMIVACFVSPLSAAPGLACEKEDHTLGLLLLSGVNSFEIVIGKAFGPLFSTVLMILGTMPVIVLCEAMGGISAAQILGGIAVLIVTVFTGTSLGLAVSAVFGTVRRALAMTFLALIIWYVVLPVSVLSMDELYGWPWLHDVMLPLVSTGIMLDCVITGDLHLLPWHCAVQGGAGVLFLLSACISLPLLAWEREPRVVVKTTREHGFFRGSNPVAWKEKFSSFSIRTQFLLGCLTVCLCMAGGYLLADTKIADELFECPSDYLLIGLMLIWLVTILVIGAGVMVNSLAAFSQEKRIRSLDLLMISDLSMTDIVLGKLWHSLSSIMPWLVLHLLVIAPLCIRMPHRSEIMELIGCEIAILSLLPAIAGISMYASLCLRPSLAITAAVTASVGLVGLTAMYASVELIGVAGSAVYNISILAWSLQKISYRLRQLSYGKKIW